MYCYCYFYRGRRLESIFKDGFVFKLELYIVMIIFKLNSEENYIYSIC